MSEIVQKKMVMKIFDTPLSSNEMKGYAASKDVKISSVSKDTFLLGEISIDSHIYGLLGLDKEYWSDDKKSAPNLDILDRIILRLYDRSGRNIGLIEERVLKELSESTIGGRLPSFTITLSHLEYLIDIEKESDKFVFPLLMEKSKGIFEIFQITKKGMAIGADYIVTRKLADEKVAFIDSKRGGKIEIDIYNKELAENNLFTATLALFAGTIKYHAGIATKLENAVKAMKEGVLTIKPSKKALELILNPRRSKSTGASKEESKEEEPVRRKKKKRRSRKDEDEDDEETPKKRIKRRIRDEEEEEDKEDLPRKKSKGKSRREEEDEEQESSNKKKKFEPLYAEDPVKEVPSITKAISEALEEVGITTVEQLLSADPDDLEEELDIPSITSKKIKMWQKLSQKQIKETIESEEGIDEEDGQYDLLDYDI